MRDDGHRRVLAHVVDEPGAAARHHQVDEVVHAQQLIDMGAVGVADNLGGAGGELGACEGVVQQVAEHGVAVHGLLATPQHRRVPALEAEGGDVDSHIRARLVDAGDDAQGHALARDLEAVGEGACVDGLADGVGQGGDVAGIGGHARDTRGSEGEAVEEVVVQPRFVAGCEVLRVLRQDRALALEQEHGDALERVVLGVGRGNGEAFRGVAGGLSLLADARKGRGHGGKCSRFLLCVRRGHA